MSFIEFIVYFACDLIADTILFVFHRTSIIEREVTIVDIFTCPLGITPIIGMSSSIALSNSHCIQELWLAYTPAKAKITLDAPTFCVSLVFT